MTTIATRLTPAVPAAIATLGVAGPAALTVLKRFVRPPGADLKVGGVRFATWRIPLLTSAATAVQPQTADEHVVLTRPSQDTFEVHCHGGVAVCQRLLSDLVQAGCSAVEVDQWPSRLSCPLARAAEHDLQLATTDRAAAVLLDQMNGALRSGILAAHHKLLQRDSTGLSQLLHWADFGAHLSQPWRVVLAGPPNVGKSSLLNALAGTRQSIVHHEPGTTRDWIQWPTAVDGWPVVFTDTAGVRQTGEDIERTGVERGLGQVRHADLVVLVVDAQQGWSEAHSQLMSYSPPRCLIVFNKVDLARPNFESVPFNVGSEVIGPTAEREKSQVRTMDEHTMDEHTMDEHTMDEHADEHTVEHTVEHAVENTVEHSAEHTVGHSAGHGVGSGSLDSEPRAAGPMLLTTSAVDGTGIESLVRAIANVLVPESPAEGAAVPFRAEHLRHLNCSWQSAQRGGWAAAAEQLCECLTGTASATLGVIRS